MFTAYVVVTLLAIAANTFSGVAALVHFKPILPGMAKAGVPESWLTVLGILKTAGAVGLLLGLIGVPLIGTAAAIGLILFFIGAIITHLRYDRKLWMEDFLKNVVYLPFEQSNGKPARQRRREGHTDAKDTSGQRGPRGTPPVRS